MKKSFKKLKVLLK